MRAFDLEATFAMTKRVKRKAQERDGTNQVQRRDRRQRRRKCGTGVRAGGGFEDGRWFVIWLAMAARQRAAYKQFLPPFPHMHPQQWGKQPSSLRESQRGSRTVSLPDTGRVWSRKWMYSGSGAWLFGEMNHCVLWSPLKLAVDFTGTRIWCYELHIKEKCGEQREADVCFRCNSEYFK